jgi:hypothetical protein
MNADLAFAELATLKWSPEIARLIDAARVRDVRLAVYTASKRAQRR